ncbi:MAG: right-handed parallel beta-helix repeat-containing protein [Bryobacteraceae bacterium]
MRAILSVLICLLPVVLASCTARSASLGPARTVTVAQSGSADVTGTDDAALQKAVGLLHPGDTLSIGPGTYEMNNSVFIPSGVTVRGVPGQTILRKSKGVESALAEDGDYGEGLLNVLEPQKFHSGMGLAILDDKLNSGWDISISAVTSVEGRTLHIDPMTLRDYNAEELHAKVRNTYPILCVMHAADVVLDGITVDGNRAENAYIDGCRGGAIYMYRVRNVTVRNCVARNYNGDGISFQISDRVKVENCESFGHAGYGVHPGTGTEAPVVQNCKLHDNGDIGLFLCWRVRHGKFINNSMEHNGHYGISIGHKDTDNEFTGNTIASNGVSGVYFRNETFLNSGHRNTFRDNKVLDNGNEKAGYGFYIEPKAGDIVIENNQIADTRSTGRTQRYGIYKVAGAGTVRNANNQMSGHANGDYAEGTVKQAAR